MRAAYAPGALGLIVGLVAGYVIALKTVSTEGLSPTSNATRASDQGSSAMGQSIAPSTTTQPPENSSIAGITPSVDVIADASSDQTTIALVQLRNASFGERYAFMQRLASNSFDELEQQAAQFLGLGEQAAWKQEEAFRLLISRMIELDRDQTMEFVTQRYGAGAGIGGREGHRFSGALASLSHTHVDDLVAWSDSLPSKQQRREFLHTVLRGYAEVDPEQAVALYQQQDFGTGEQFPYDILHVWSQNDPYAAMNWVMSQSNFNIGDGSAQSVFSSWAYEDPDAAIAYLDTIGDSRVKSELEVLVLGGLAQKNPQAAIEQAMAMTEEHKRVEGMQSALMTWGATSPLEALEYVNSYLSGSDQEMAYQILASAVQMDSYGHFGDEPLEKLQQSENLPPPIRLAIRQSTIGFLFDEDPVAALAWLETVSDEPERNQLFMSIAWRLPEHDVQLAQTMFEQSTGEARLILGSSIAQHLVETDPEQAMSWYEQLPDIELRQQMRMIMAEQMAVTDPARALAMLDDGNEIQDIGMLGPVFFQVAMTNRPLAEQWLQQANVSESVRTELGQIMQEMSLQQFRMHDYGLGGAMDHYVPREY